MGHRELGGQREADLDSAEYRSTGRVVKTPSRRLKPSHGDE